MQSYIDKAEQIISPKITGIIRRNRVISKATNLFIEDPKNFSRLHTWYKKDIVNDDMRAEHYGVTIGTQVGWIKSPKDKQYFIKVARVKKEFRQLMVQSRKYQPQPNKHHDRENS